MKNKLCNISILLLFLFKINTVFSQDAELKIKQNEKVDSLLKKKIAFDREVFKNSYFTLQLYYGNLNLANKVLEESKAKFPHIPIELSFETPNYKVQAGRFKDKLLGLKTLDTIKKSFPSAFLLKRRN